MPVPGIAFPKPALLRQHSLSRLSPLLQPLSSRKSTSWTGRKPDEHAVNRTAAKDAQSQPSQQSLNEKNKGDSLSHGVSEKGGEANKKVEKEQPKTPKPVIGMNDERGGKP